MTRSDDSTKPRDVREPLRWPTARFAMSPERWAAWLGVEMLRTPRQWEALYGYRVHTSRPAVTEAAA